MKKEIGVRFFEDRGIIKIHKWISDEKGVRGVIRPVTKNDTTWMRLCLTLKGR